MSGLVHKIKDAMTSDKSSEPAGSHGPHQTRTGNVADPRVDSDRDNRAAGAGNTLGTGSTTDNFGTSGTGITGAPGGSGTTGPTGATGTSGITGGHGSSNTRAGPHQSDMANKMDPRVDSDRDNRGAPGSTTGAYGSSTTGGHGTSGMGRTENTYGTENAYGAGTAGGYSSSNTRAGPHQSDMANKMDPRVDSDRDNRGAPGGTTGGYGTSGMGRTENTYGTENAYGTGTAGGYGSSNTRAGPHQSGMANKMDPRVDSDRDNRAAPGASLGGNNFNSGATAGGLGAGQTSGTTGTTAGYGGSTNPGPAPSTAGPHKQDMMNKMDPRVDSDLDNSKTMGQDKTFSRP